jgi:outer membrane biosynthesis protein TonB
VHLVRLVVTICAGLALAALGSFAAVEPSKIYECKDAKGNTVYQGEPCIEPAPTATPPAPRPPAEKPDKIQKPRAKSKPKAVAPTPPPAKPPAPPPTQVLAFPQPPSPRSTHAEPPSANDGRWASPEKALQTFVGAVKAGDRALVVASLTSGALADLGPDASDVPMDALRETVGSFTGYVSEGDLGPYFSIRALRAGARPKWIFFERVVSGMWKISAF